MAAKLRARNRARSVSHEWLVAYRGYQRQMSLRDYKSMQKLKRKFITYYMPGTLFPETSSAEVKSFDVPKSVPLDCYGFSFSETEFVVDGKKEFSGETKQDKRFFLIGESVPLAQIPDDDKHSILRSNIEFNSPTKMGVKTHVGNWQMEAENTVVISPSSLKFTKPLIWKNIKTAV